MKPYGLKILHGPKSNGILENDLRDFYTLSALLGSAMIDRIQWLGHGSFRIQGSPSIYINPWRLTRTDVLADIILVTNDLYDHCSPADIEKLSTPDTVVIANDSAAALIGDHALILRPWQSANVGKARITAVPAYTFTDHHPISKGELGFIVSLDYYDIYYAGSTDMVPEMNYIQADIAILPVGVGQGTLNLDGTVKLVEKMKPLWVVPSHWGGSGGTLLDVQALNRALEGQTNVVMPEKVRF
jgi:L-ascorbate metabolism protein UlaG (beta-lactamase superfamily)